MANLERITESSLPSSYVDGEDVTHLDFNKIISMFRAGINANYSDIQNIWNGVNTVENANKLSNAILSKLSTTILLNDDTKIPTAAQVFSAMNTLSTNIGTVIGVVKGCAKSYKILEDTACTSNTENHISLGDLIGGFGTNITLDTNDIKLGGTNTTLDMFVQLGITTTSDAIITLSIDLNDVTEYTTTEKVSNGTSIIKAKIPFINFSTNNIVKIKVNPDNNCTINIDNSHIDARILG